MFDENSGGDSGEETIENIKTKIAYNAEALIPIFLILIMGFFIGAKMGIIDVSGIPFLGDVVGKEMPKILVIGTPSEQLSNAFLTLQAQGYIKKVDNISPANFSRNKESVLSVLGNYDIVILDQQLDADKVIPVVLAEALDTYVKRGGKLIVVGNSGIRRSGGYPDIYGWERELGDVMPVSCSAIGTDTKGCEQPMVITGRLWVTDHEHPITKGFDVIPPLTEQPIVFNNVFDIYVKGNELAYIQQEDEFGRGVPYPAIVEAKLLIGKVIYFNYDPGLTPGVFKSTIDYMS